LTEEEHKYLGGDMNHTHLVKGLDYALLAKTRAETAAKEKEEKEINSLKQEYVKNIIINHNVLLH